MRLRRQEYGFSLIELLIVIAIIGVLAAVTIQQFLGSTRKANEAAAVTTLNSIKVAQAKYVMEYKRYGTFAQLYEEGFLDKRFRADMPHINGYIFTITLLDLNDKRGALFQLNANPEISEGMAATGKVFYFTQPDGGITFSRTGPATEDDDPL